jgi:hypothetical protein
LSKQNAARIVHAIKDTFEKRTPEILTGIGIAGMITTTVLAVKATPKAILLLNDRKDELETESLPITEVVKTTWKCYIPAAVTCGASVACLIGASSVNLKRNAALATAYKLSETALAEYRDAVVETIGEKKERDIRDKVAEKRVKKNPVTKSDVIVTGNGITLCFDAISGRYFQSSMQKIESAKNKINERMLCENYVSLNDLYEELGMECTKIGDDLGWNIFGDGLLDISFSSQLADDGTPCLVMDYSVAPRYNYYKSC